MESPFAEANAVTDLELEDLDRAFRMDFENYTLGSLVQGRANYDYNHKEYSDIRRQVLWRVGDLGFSNEQFAEVDGFIDDAFLAFTRSKSKGRALRKEILLGCFL